MYKSNYTKNSIAKIESFANKKSSDNDYLALLGKLRDAEFIEPELVKRYRIIAIANQIEKMNLLAQDHLFLLSLFAIIVC